MKLEQTTADLILFALEKAVDGYIRLEDFASNTHIYASGYDRPLKKSSLAQTLRRLRLKGFLETDKQQTETILKLTDKGKNEAILRKILKNENWDGKWRVVIFDIPEVNKKTRDIFRSRLKLWEFQQLQKSVWVTKKNIIPILREFTKELHLERWVLFFEATDLG